MAIRSLSSTLSPPFNPVNREILIPKSAKVSFARNGNSRRICFLRKVKMSAEGDLLVREPVATNDTDGETVLEISDDLTPRAGASTSFPDQGGEGHTLVNTTPPASLRPSAVLANVDDIEIVSIHHVGLLCQNLEKSLDFYQNLLGLKINEARPHEKLPYRGAWLWVGSEMIHLMELPNPDPLTGRPEHGGRDRHACIAIRDVSKLKAAFDKAGIKYTLSRSGRPAIFTRDPDGNALEFTQVD